MLYFENNNYTTLEYAIAKSMQSLPNSTRREYRYQKGGMRIFTRDANLLFFRRLDTLDVRAA